MASSSVSQEDVENDFELSSRRSRIRTARARTVNPPTRIDPGGGDFEDGGGGDMKPSESLNIGSFPTEHDASPKPLGRAKEKRVNRSNHMNKGKQQRDRRKLREKRRSTGVVHLPSTESTGGSTGEDEDEVLSMTAETRRNTQHNELLDRDPASMVEVGRDRVPPKTFPQRRNKSPSDLEADDEDNQEFDSLNQSDSTVSSLVHQSESMCRGRAPNGRPGTPTGENLDELLERAQEENRRLLSLLEERDHKIVALENKISQMQRDMMLAGSEREKLKEDNAALIRAMASLATK